MSEHPAAARPRCVGLPPHSSSSGGKQFLRFRTPFHHELAVGARRNGFDAAETTDLLVAADAVAKKARPLGILLAGVLAALLAPFQFFAFPATYLIVALYVLTTGGWRKRTVWRDAVLFLAPVVLAAPFIVDAISRQGDTGAFRFVLWWSEARVQDGPAAVAFFYLTNLGIPTVLAVIAAFTARGMPARWFLVAWMVALFIVPNIIVVSAVEFDMNKYFQIMWIAVATCRLADPQLAPIARGGAAHRLCLLAGVDRGLAPALGHGRAGAAPGDGGALDRRQHTGRSVFVTDDFINSPVDLAGACASRRSGRTSRTSATTPAARGRHEGDLLRRPGRGRQPDGRVRRDVRAVERREPLRQPPGTDFPRVTSCRPSTTRTASRSGG